MLEQWDKRFILTKFELIQNIRNFSIHSQWEGA